MGVTWLHLSDFHIRSGDPYDRDKVLRALIRAVGYYRKNDRRPDLIFATGDIAHAGKPQEYNLATTFFDDLLTEAQIDKSCLFVVPGNHDVDRDMAAGLARTLESREQADSYFNPDRPQPHLDYKLRAFSDWYNHYFARIRTMPERSTCSEPVSIEVNGSSVAILSVNSALFCQDDDDHGKLWIGRRCLDEATKQMRAHSADLKIALIHHPLEWLNAWEGENIRAAIESTVDILLRGHLHKTRIEVSASVTGGLLHCAAGAAYQSRRWPQCALYCTFEGGELNVFPIRYEDSPEEVWTVDPSMFPREANFEGRFAIPRLASEKVNQSIGIDLPLTKFRTNIPSRGSRPFVGRDSVVEEMRSKLFTPTSESVLILQGPPGVGKSELAREFARQHRDRYPGGTFSVDASTDAIAIDLARIGKNILLITSGTGISLDDQGEITFYKLSSTPVLIIYDNVRSLDAVLPWLPRHGLPCHILITTVLDGIDPRWNSIEVPPLSDQNAFQLIQELVGTEIAHRYGQTIVNQSGGLPVQILPTCATLAYEQRRGRLAGGRLVVARETAESFRAVYSRLPPSSRLLLHAAAVLNPQRLPVHELRHALRNALGWSSADVERAQDICFDLHLLNGLPDPNMHQLFASFLRDTTPLIEDQSELSQVRLVQRKRFVELAKLLLATPADAEIATTFLCYPLDPALWHSLGQPLSTEEDELVGRALFEIGRLEAIPWAVHVVKAYESPGNPHPVDPGVLARYFNQVGYCLATASKNEEALTWFQRGLAEFEKATGRQGVDHEYFGRCLNHVGYCLLRMGKHKDALAYFDRAVSEAEQGDSLGKIIHASVGISLHHVGSCLLKDGRPEEAQSRFESAIEAKRKGDQNGQIDCRSLGISLHQVGECLLTMGRHDAAQVWFRRASTETVKPDAHGRIDHFLHGVSLHRIGDCMVRSGAHEEAPSWFKAAAEAKNKGNLHGRVDYTSLGRTQHDVGLCLLSTGHTDEALSWFERAVQSKERGDLWGRVEHRSLSDSLNQVGSCFVSAGRGEDAEAWFERAALVAKIGETPDQEIREARPELTVAPSLGDD